MLGAARPLLMATFVRELHKRDAVHVVRSDGTTTSWLFPTYGDGLPHDLVHLVVEAAFGLRQGFWGRVDQGIDPGVINDEANRRGGPDRYRAYGEDRREILIAEALAAMHWYDPNEDASALCASVSESCAGFGVPPPADCAQWRATAVREALVLLRRRWRALGDHGALAVRFRPNDPAAGLSELLGGGSS